MTTERDLARIHGERFGFPMAVAPAALDSAPSFVLLGSELRLRPGFSDLSEFATMAFPHRTFQPLRPELGLSIRR